MLCAGVALCFAPLAVHFSGLAFNSTDSVPVGFYRQVANGPYAAICLPTDTLRWARSRGLDLKDGSCPTGVLPILKPVYLASPQHPIQFSELGFEIDGKLLPNTAPKQYSKTGALLRHIEFGIYREGLFAISSFSRDSFDSRYFGPIATCDIKYRAKPVWTF